MITSGLGSTIRANGLPRNNPPANDDSIPGRVQTPFDPGNITADEVRPKNRRFLSALYRSSGVEKTMRAWGVAQMDFRLSTLSLAAFQPGISSTNFFRYFFCIFLRDPLLHLRSAHHRRIGLQLRSNFTHPFETTRKRSKKNINVLICNRISGKNLPVCLRGQ